MGNDINVISADNVPHDHFFPNCVMTIHPTYTLTLANGKVYQFDWHKYLGPTFLRKDGEPLARYPGVRNPMWKTFDLWHSQGRMVDNDGNCVWKESVNE